MLVAGPNINHQSLLQEHSHSMESSLLCNYTSARAVLAARSVLAAITHCLWCMQLSGDEGLDLDQLASDCLDGR